MLVEFAPDELQQLNELAQDAHEHNHRFMIEMRPVLLAKALDALARYQEAERVAAENGVTGVHRLRTRPRE